MALSELQLDRILSGNTEAPMSLEMIQHDARYHRKQIIQLEAIPRRTPQQREKHYNHIAALYRLQASANYWYGVAV